MKINKDSQIKPIWIFIALVIMTAIIICFAPGMAMLEAINHYGHLSLDKARIWGYSILTSLIIFLGLYFGSKKNFSSALKFYTLISFGVIALTVFLLYKYQAGLYEIIYSDFIGIVNNAKG